jgi:hypothetical protein
VLIRPGITPCFIRVDVNPGFELHIEPIIAKKEGRSVSTISDISSLFNSENLTKRAGMDDSWIFLEMFPVSI